MRLAYHPFSVGIDGIEQNSREYAKKLCASRMGRLVACFPYEMFWIL